MKSKHGPLFLEIKVHPDYLVVRELPGYHSCHLKVFSFNSLIRRHLLLSRWVQPFWRSSRCGLGHTLNQFVYLCSGSPDKAWIQTIPKSSPHTLETMIFPAWCQVWPSLCEGHDVVLTPLPWECCLGWMKRRYSVKVGGTIHQIPSSCYSDSNFVGGFGWGQFTFQVNLGCISSWCRRGKETTLGCGPQSQCFQIDWWSGMAQKPKRPRC